MNAETSQLVRTAVFGALLETGEPWDGQATPPAGLDRASVRAAVAELVKAGRARTDERGRVTAAAGVSVVETPHRIEAHHGTRWTQCAYDALGILGALGASGRVVSRSPSTGADIVVPFDRGVPGASDAMLFLADESSCPRPYDDWCPNVNLFEDESCAAAWAGDHGVRGRIVSLEKGTRLGAREWGPLVEGHPWMERSVSGRSTE